MKEQVIKTITKYDMISLGETVVLAVSGGVDSMVLMHLFTEFAKDFELTVIIAHLNHAKRPESVLDAQLVQQVAKQNTFVFEQDTLPKQGETGNFHAYARTYRYQFFSRVAKVYGATKVVTAHHANDHLETVIDHLMKTDIPSGLIGTRPVGVVASIPIIRPFIEVQKHDLYDYAKNFNVRFHEDMSNTSDAYLRNRIRHQIVPLMEKERPNVVRHVRGLSDHLQLDEGYFQSQVDDLMKQVRNCQHGYALSFSWLQDLHASLWRRLIMRLIPNISKGAMLGLATFFDRDVASGTYDVGQGIVVRKSYDHILIVNATFKASQLAYELELVVNAVNELPNGRKIVVNQGKLPFDEETNEKSVKSKAQGTYLCYNSVRMPLKVRNRHSGDRIKLPHGQGHARIKKIMIDAKVPLDARERWPIIVDANDQLIWIPGLASSPVCLKQPNSSEDLWLEIYE